MEWASYLSLAHELAQRDDDASLRSAISRAYYAAFHSARLLIDAEDPRRIPTNDPSAHRLVFDALRYDHGRSRKHIQAGRHLSDLRVLRNEADYRDDFQGNLQAQTKLALGKAQQVLDLLHTPP
jgi:uncharacterized protein (UPF0332 family)